MKILSLASVFPNPEETVFGLFVRSRLQAMSHSAEVKVLAPIPLLDYSNPGKNLLRRCTFASRRCDGPIEVFHPRWLFPPLGTPVNVVMLFARLLPLVWRLRNRFAFDLLDAHFGYPEGVVGAMLALFFRVPLVITFRGNEPMFAGFRYRGLAMKWAIRRAAYLITVSEELKNFAVGLGAEASRVRVIPNGIDRAAFSPRDRSAVRTAYQVPDGRRLFVTAGGLIEEKGHHLVIAGVADLVRNGVDAEVMVVGTDGRGGPRYERVLRELAEGLKIGDRVRFLGEVPRERMAGLLSAADIFCLASYTEGWPNVVNEALACGTPVVTTRVGGAPLMVPSEKYGFLVPPRDGAAFAAAMTKAIGSEWDRKAIAAWGGSRSWEQVAIEVMEVMRAATGHQPTDSLAKTGDFTNCRCQ